MRAAAEIEGIESASGVGEAEKVVEGELGE